MITDKAWLVWSNEHKGWWKNNNHGYTLDILDARRFTLEDARKVLEDGNQHRWHCLAEPHETMVPIQSLPDHLNAFNKERSWK